MCSRAIDKKRWRRGLYWEFNLLHLSGLWKWISRYFSRKLVEVILFLQVTSFSLTSHCLSPHEGFVASPCLSTLVNRNSKTIQYDLFWIGYFVALRRQWRKSLNTEIQKGSFFRGYRGNLWKWLAINYSRTMHGASIVLKYVTRKQLNFKSMVNTIYGISSSRVQFFQSPILL